jgi:hypothetical protein
MFQGGYALSELRRRWGRTLITALGLAIGVGLVIGIIGVSQGLAQAQSSVLSPLQAIGTDILVTRVAGATSTAFTTPTTTAKTTTAKTTTAKTTTAKTTTPQSGPGGGFFAAGPGGRNANLTMLPPRSW